MDNENLWSRFKGCLLGLAIGDALGAPFEGMDTYWLKERFPDREALINALPKELYYTDDTQMMIGVAESLIEDKEIVEETLCNKFVVNYNPRRGYGRGARRLLEAMENGEDYRSLRENIFIGGSYGNGAAMRVAPIGLFFHKNQQAAHHQAYLSSIPTHTHDLGIEGAQLLAISVAIAVQMEKWDKKKFFDTLMKFSSSEVYKQKLYQAYELKHETSLSEIGNAITAHESVPTAIASFMLTPNSFIETITNAVLAGGDTDTIAAMAGAISGAFLGASAIPVELLNRLENNEKGLLYIQKLATEIYSLAS